MNPGRRHAGAEGEDETGPTPVRKDGETSNTAVEAYAARRRNERPEVRGLAERAKALEQEIYHCDFGINLLTVLCKTDDLFVEFARDRTVREEQAMEDQNAEIANEYEERKAERGTIEKAAAEHVANK